MADHQFGGHIAESLFAGVQVGDMCLLSPEGVGRSAIRVPLGPVIPPLAEIFNTVGLLAELQVAR